MMKTAFLRTSLLPLLILFLACSSSPGKRVLVIGMDGLTPQLLFPMIERGELPAFSRLMGESSYGTLKSVIPPYSAQAWTSCITGVNPGRHGIHGFFRIEEGTPVDSGFTGLVFHSSMSNKAKTIWEILGSAGKTSISINMPLTSPAFEIKGLMIAGFPHPPDAPFTYPLSLQSEIPDYRPDDYGVDVRRGEEGDFLADVYDISQKRRKTALTLFTGKEWDLFFVVFTIPDRIQHYFWRYMDPQHPYYNERLVRTYGEEVRKVYVWMDEVLGDYLDRIGDDTSLIVMSDHGFRPVKRQVNGEVFLEGVNTDSFFVAHATENFGATFAVKPRYPMRMTPELEARKRYFIDRVAEQLGNLKDPATGDLIVKEVYKGEDLFSGPYLLGAPDVVGLESDEYLFLNWLEREGAPLVQYPPALRFFSGHHQVEGILFLKGKGITRGVRLEGAHILDIAPTILTLLDVPVDRDMEGKPIEAAFTGDAASPNAKRERVAYSIDVRARKYVMGEEGFANRDLEERLKSIGYIR